MADTSISASFPCTYTDTTKTSLSGSRSTAAVRSADATGSCSASMSLRTQSMLRIGQSASYLFVGIIFVQLLCHVGLVTTLSSTSLAYGSDTASTP